MSQAVIRSLRRRRYLPLRYPLRAVIDSVNGYQQRGLHNGRLPQNCIEPIKYQVGILMQFFAMTVLIKPRRDHTFHLSLYPSPYNYPKINRAKRTLLFSFQFSPFTLTFSPSYIYHAHAREGFIAKDMSDGVFSQGDAAKIFAKTLGV